MSKKVVLLLYKTLYKELYNQNNKSGLEILKKNAKENKYFINKTRINLEIQRMIDVLIYLNSLNERNKK